MYQINTTTKKFTEAVTIDLGQLPTVDTRIDFILTDGTNPVIAENKTFAMTIGTVLGSLYKTDADTVSFRYLKFNDDNIADTLVITMTMDGVEILNDTVSLKYQRECVDKDALEEAINAKADKATTIAGYGITDAYTKTEIDGKVASVYHYKGTVSAYADLPASGQEAGDVYNVETADSTHGIKAGDNVAWTGSEWDVLAGEIDLSAYATKTELEAKLDAPATPGTVGQVLTKTADGQEWADAQGGATTDVVAALDDLNEMLESYVGVLDDKDFFHVTALEDTGVKFKGLTNSDYNYEYSYDRRKWYQFVNSDVPVEVKSGCKLWIRNRAETTKFCQYNNPVLTSTGRFTVGGKALSLASKSIDDTIQITLTNLQCSLFQNANTLVGIEDGFMLPEGIINMQYFFSGCTSLEHLPDTFDFPSNLQNIESFFYNCSSLASLPDGFTIPSSVTSMNSCFRECSSLASLPDGFTIPSSVTSMNSCFYNCKNMKTIGNNVNINPSTTDEGSFNRNNITSIGTGLNYKSAYTTSYASAQTVFPNATIGAGYHIYQFTDEE